MRAVKFSIEEREYFLLFNARSMFAIDEVYGGASKLMEQAQESSGRGLDTLCQATAILAEQGELARRTLGYDHGHWPDGERWAVLASPLDVAQMRAALWRAIALGYGREVQPEGDVDLGLVELAQKKTRE